MMTHVVFGLLVAFFLIRMANRYFQYRKMAAVLPPRPPILPPPPDPIEGRET